MMNFLAGPADDIAGNDTVPTTAAGAAAKTAQATAATTAAAGAAAGACSPHSTKTQQSTCAAEQPSGSASRFFLYVLSDFICASSCHSV